MIRAALIIAITLSNLSAQGAGWRTDGTSRYPQANPVLEWGAEKNVLWHAPTENWGNASPVVHGDRVFIGMEPDRLLCIDRKTGAQLWEQQVVEQLPADEQAAMQEARDTLARLDQEQRTARGQVRQLKRRITEAEKAEETADTEKLREELKQLEAKMSTLGEQMKPLAQYRRPRTHGVNGYTTPTPVVDGDGVYTMTGEGLVARLSLVGEQQWMVKAGVPSAGWGHSRSLAMADDRLIVHVDKTLMALDPKTGETLWEQEAKGTWGSPIVVPFGDGMAVVTDGGSVFAAADGTPIAENLLKMPWNSAVYVDGILYAFDSKDARAVKLPAAAGGEPEVLWTQKVSGDRFYSSPIVHNGIIWNVNRKGLLIALDAKSGEVLYEEQLKGAKGTYYPSPILAGEHLVVSCDDGTSFVLETGRSFKQVGANPLSRFRSVPVIDGDQLFIRALNGLYCIGR